MPAAAVRFCPDECITVCPGTSGPIIIVGGGRDGIGGVVHAEPGVRSP